MRKEEWKKSVLDSLAGLSRTLSGISDISSSADKPKLGVSEGDKLVLQTHKNIELTLDFLWENRKKSFHSPKDVREFCNFLAFQVSEGLLPTGQSLYRTWETKFGQTSPSAIESEYQNFCSWLYSAFKGKEFDYKIIAAIVEQRLDGKIHPFADGCGRSAKLFSAFIRLSGGYMPAKYPSRREYYSRINGTESDWVFWHRLL